MSTQQDIYATGSENRPPMLNNDNYVPWSAGLLRYAKSKPNRKLLYNFIINDPNCTYRPRRKDDAYLQTQFLIAQKEEARIQLQAEEFDLMTAICDIDEIEEVNANCILMTNLQQASILGTRTDKALVYDSNISSKIVEAIDLTKPVFSHFVPKTQESKAVTNANVIAPKTFRINPLKNSKEDTFVPNNQVKASVRTKPITVIQPRVNTKKHVNSNINGLSSTRVDNTTKTRRVEPRSMNQMTKNWPTYKCSYVTKTYVPKAEHSRSSSSFRLQMLYLLDMSEMCL
ncbi:hypothetical protein Tco_0351517 [Tanacetum coccineum]